MVTRSMDLFVSVLYGICYNILCSTDFTIVEYSRGDRVVGEICGGGGGWDFQGFFPFRGAGLVLTLLTVCSPATAKNLTK